MGYIAVVSRMILTPDSQIQTTFTVVNDASPYNYTELDNTFTLMSVSGGTAASTRIAVESQIQTWATGRSLTPLVKIVWFIPELDALPIGRLYLNSTSKMNGKVFVGTATVASGVATYYLTDNGLAGGNALFTNIYTLSSYYNDSNTIYADSYVVSGDKKTLTLTAKKQQFTTGLIGIVTALLGVSMVAANGATPALFIIGD